MSLVSSLTSLVTGGAGITTLISGGISAVVNLKERSMQLKHEVDMLPHKEKEWAFQLDQQKRAIANDEFMAEKGLIESQSAGANELSKAAITADMQEVVAALKMKGQRWWVGALRTLNRPALTWGLLIVIFISMFLGLDPDNAIQVGTMDTIARMAEAAFGFWFGGRIVRSGK